MGKLEEAIQSFDKAVEVCLDDADMDASAINRMGNAYIDLGKFDEALECFNKAISLEKHNIDFLLNKGVVLMELGKFEEAVDSFNKVLLRNPDNEDAFFLKRRMFGKLFPSGSCRCRHDIFIDMKNQLFYFKNSYYFNDGFKVKLAFNYIYNQYNQN